MAIAQLSKKKSGLRTFLLVTFALGLSSIGGGGDPI